MRTHLDHVDVEQLWVSCLGVQPVERDWTEGWPEEWEFFEAPSCPECDTYAGWHQARNEWECFNRDCDNRGQEIEPEDQEGPMMNYSYAVDTWRESPQEAADRISHLPLCVVTFSDDGAYDGIHLALTGGGMDLSWEICEAYILLGYLPPVHFADLPAMAGYPRHSDHEKVMEACLRAVNTFGQRYTEEGSVLEQRFKRMREEVAAGRDAG
jgi:hypothetical protein